MNLRGFTLLELLVASAITVLLAGLCLAVADGMTKAWQRSQGNATVQAEAMLVLDLLERDLQAAVLRRDGRAWIDVRIPAAGELGAHGWTVQPLMKPAAESLRPIPPEGETAGIAASRFGTAGVWLRLVTFDHDGETRLSLPCVIAYQVVRRPVSSAAGAPVRYALFREKLAARHTHDNVLATLFTPATPAELTAPDNADVLASNVVDFGVWFHRRDPDGRLVRIYPDGGTAAQWPPDGAPVVADVMVRVLTESGAVRLEALETGRAHPPAGRNFGEWWWEVVESHSRVHVRRIELRGGTGWK